MDEPGFIPTARIAIAGLGLMGGSLALALHGHCRELLGLDSNPQTVALARKLEIVDEATTQPQSVLPRAEVIILALPIQAILSLIRELPQLHPERALVLDLGSTKRQICQALAALPERFDPLGGHPMCGKEVLGLEHADAALYQGAAFAFSPTPQTSQQARQFAAELSTLLGSRALWLDPEIHDLWAAQISHLPYLLAACLTQATTTAAASLIGSGFRSATRLAGTPASMMLDVLFTNPDAILWTIERFHEQLEAVRSAIIQKDELVLRTWMEAATARRLELLKPIPQEEIR